MTLQKPKVEFVAIDTNMFIQNASGCPDWATETPAGGGQRCIAAQPDAQGCTSFDDSIPW